MTFEKYSLIFHFLFIDLLYPISDIFLGSFIFRIKRRHQFCLNLRSSIRNRRYLYNLFIRHNLFNQLLIRILNLHQIRLGRAIIDSEEGDAILGIGLQLPATRPDLKLLQEERAILISQYLREVLVIFNR